MNGCQYLRPTFTLPASTKTSDVRWDFATLSRKEFVKKYPMLEGFYERLLSGSMKLD